MTEQDYPRFQNYEILDLIGTGGMGSVYRAKDKLGEEVALKVIHSELGVKEEFRARFYSEAAMLRGLGRHANIVFLWGLFGETQPGQEHETLFIVMDYVEGADVAALMQGSDGIPGTGLLPEASALPILRQAAAAIEFAHSEHVIHRDIKPSNILVLRQDDLGPPKLKSEADVQVMDFGLARASYAPRMTATGVIGTPEYMAPELFREGSDGGDDQTDIYALGITAYEMMTNSVPFRSTSEDTMASLIQIATDKMEQDPPLPSTFYPPLDKGVEAMIMKAITPRPEDRYGSVTEMIAAVDAEMARLGIEMPGASGQASGPSAQTVPIEMSHQSSQSDPSAAASLPVAAGIWAAALACGLLVGWILP
jgi:serine/threonine-protein kinase